MASYLRGSTAANLLAQKWMAGFDVEAEESAVLYPQVKQLPRPYKTLNMPQLDRLSSSVYTDAASDTGLTFQANTETAFTTTQRARVLPVEILETAVAEMLSDPESEWRTMLPKATASAIDSDLLALAGSLTTNTVGSDVVSVDFSLIASADEKLVISGLEAAKPGMGATKICVLAATQHADMIAIDKFTNAQFRGDRANPIVSGWVFSALGIDFYESTNVQVSGSQANNVLLIPRAMGIGFNQKPAIATSMYQGIYRHLVCWASYGYGTIRDKYAVLVKTISS